MKIEVITVEPVFKLELHKEEVEAIYRLLGCHIVGSGRIRDVFSGIYCEIDNLNIEHKLNLNSTQIKCDTDRPLVKATLFVTGE